MGIDNLNRFWICSWVEFRNPFTIQFSLCFVVHPCRHTTYTNIDRELVQTKEIMSDLYDRTNGQSTAKSNRVSGVVKFYSVQKCYGFIKRDDTKEYVFVHSKSVTGKNERRVTRSLAKGERVEFEVVMSDRSPEAINVTGLNDGPVLGSEYALITMQW